VYAQWTEGIYLVQTQKSDRTPSFATKVTTATQVRTQQRVKHESRESGTALPKSDEDEVETVDVRPVSRAPMNEVQARPEVAVAPSQAEHQAQRERKKAILMKRLERLEIEQQLLEMED
jgi:hypothetical protein